jgi:uncharacterized OB-fold protein
MTTATVTPVEPLLFASLAPPRLAGSRCASCQTVMFPAQGGCAKCAGSDMQPVELADHGTLWTWTLQEFEPKPPYRMPEEGFTPYPVGYVDLGEVIVESRLVGAVRDLQIGVPMQLTLLPLWVDPGGSQVVTYAFTPEGGAA